MWWAKEDNKKGTCNNGRVRLECEGWEGRGGVGGEGWSGREGGEWEEKEVEEKVGVWIQWEEW